MKLIIFLTFLYGAVGLIAKYAIHDQDLANVSQIISAIFIAAWCLGDLIKKGRAQ